MMMGRRGDDRGQALPLALVMLTFFSLVIGVILAFADTSFRATHAIRGQRDVQYGLDGAVEAAIDRYRSDGTCLTSPPQVNEVSAAVTCDEATGSGGGGGNSPDNTPPLAIIVRATGSEEGIRQASSALLRVRGGVYSNTNIVTPAGNMHVTGTVRARTGCDEDDITATEDIDCGLVGAYPDGEDPNYPPETDTAPPAQSVPANCSGLTHVELEPGTYSGAGLGNLLNHATCNNRVFWFKPDPSGDVGTFYFDDVGEIVVGNNRQILGGSPCIGADPRPGCPEVAPDIANITDIPFGNWCNPEEDGVQFIFGGESRMFVNNGSVELCAHPNTTEQRIAVYGRASSVVTLNPTAGNSSAGPNNAAFAPTADALTVDESTANATVVRTGPRLASIELTGYESSIPAGSTINSVTMRVVHQEILNQGPNYSRFRITGVVVDGEGTTLPTIPDSAFGKSSTLHTDSIDLKSRGIDTPAELSTLSVTYGVEALNQSPTTEVDARLDGIEIEVDYTPPGLKSQSGCITRTPYGGAGTCALLRSNGGSSQLAVRGTVYAPTAALDVQLTNVAFEVFERGVIVRHLRANITPAAEFTESPFRLPEDVGSEGADLVLFTAVPPGGGPVLRALVEFAEGEPPKILNWSFDRGG